MDFILDSRQMYFCDSETIANTTPSEVLMERAGTAVFEAVRQYFNCERAVVVCGGGNNGGDGLISANKLKENGFDVSVYMCTGKLNKECNKQYLRAREAGIAFLGKSDFSSFSVIIDAIFGIGLKSEPSGAFLDVIKKVNSSGVPVLSVDIPSGLCANSGKKMGECVKAEMTVAMETYKRGHLILDGIEVCGKIVLAHLGIDTKCVEDENPPIVYNLHDFYKDLPIRPKNANKGTFGRVLVIGSSMTMCGAAYFSALAAYRSGAGIVEIFAPRENKIQLQTLLPEAIVTAYENNHFDSKLLGECLKLATAVVVGPGLSTDDVAEKMLYYTFENCKVPIVVDADALNIISKGIVEYPKNIPVIVTPHPGEMARLCHKSIGEIIENPWDIAVRYSKDNNVICVLKGARTAVADVESLYVNGNGTTALSKGGSGDVLCGIIAGLLTQGMEPKKSAVAGVLLHSLAGIWAEDKYGEYSPLARDICDGIASLLKNGKKVGNNG